MWAALVAFAFVVSACGSTVAEEIEASGSDSSTQAQPARSEAEGSSIAKPADDPAATVHGRSVRWEAVVVEDVGHSLTVTFTGGPSGPLTELCNTDYEVVVEETPDDVVLTVYELDLAEPIEWPDDYACNDVGYPWKIGVTPQSVLGGRTFIDGHDRSVHPVIDETRILMPTWIPEGWVELYRNTYDDALAIAYGPKDSVFPPLQFTSAPTDNESNNDDFWRSLDLTTVEDVNVRGISGSGAFLVTSQEDGSRTIVFNDDGRHFTTAQQEVDLSVATQFVDGLSRG